MSQKQTYPECMTTLVEALVAFLKGAKKTLTVEANLDHEAPLFGKPYVDGPRTYKVADVLAACRRMLDYCRSAAGNPHSKLSAGFNAAGEVHGRLGRGALAELLAQTNRNGKFIVAAMANGFKGNGPKHRAMDTFKRAQSDVILWTVKGVEGDFTSKKQAIKAGCRTLFAEDWKDANSLANEDDARMERAAIKARVPLMRNGEPVTGKQAPVSTAAPTASVNAKQAKDMAKAMGATSADLRTKATAVAFLAARGINL